MNISNIQTLILALSSGLLLGLLLIILIASGDRALAYIKVKSGK